jgi:hypothetical protein
VAPADIRTVRSTLNAGATLDRVQRVGKDAPHYWVHKDLYKTLARIRARSMVVPAGPRQIAAPSAQGSRYGGSITEQSKAIEHRPSAVEHDQEESRVLRAKYVAHLLEAIYLDPADYEELFGPAFNAAVAANGAFTRARQCNQMLDQQLSERDDQAHSAFEQAFSHLRGKLGSRQNWERQLLQDAHKELLQNWEVLMLMPNGPYETVLRSMVEALEADAGAGGLSTEQAELYDIARALVDAFRANARGNEMSWRRLEVSFNQAPLAGEKRVAFDDGRNRLN